MAKLTSVSIEKAKPGRFEGEGDERVFVEGPWRREISDAGSGLWLVVQKSGAKSFATRFRFNREPQKLTHGSWPALSLKAARLASAAALKLVEDGINPCELKKAEKEEQKQIEADTVKVICNEYLDRHKKLRSIKRRKQDLERLVFPRIGSRPVMELRRSEIVRMLDAVEDENGVTMTDQVLSLLTTVFIWHSARDDHFRSPIVRGMRRTKASERARDRILSDDELRRVWLAAEAGRSPFGRFVMFALLTACRRNEAAHLPWDEVENGIWTLPASRSKTKAEITRPLSAAALRLLADAPNVQGCKFVFSNDGERALGGFNRWKQRLDEASGVSGYTLHDCRRTARSMLSRCGVPDTVAERCLGHVIGGVKGIYDRHSYIPEMRAAYEKLATLIESIVRPQSNVVPMRG